MIILFIIGTGIIVTVLVVDITKEQREKKDMEYLKNYFRYTMWRRMGIPSDVLKIANTTASASVEFCIAAKAMYETRKRFEQFVKAYLKAATKRGA